MMRFVALVVLHGASCLGAEDMGEVGEMRDDPESLRLCSLPCLLTYPDGADVMLRKGCGRFRELVFGICISLTLA